MAIGMLVDNPAGTQEIYEKVRELAGLNGPAGGVVHLAGPRPGGGWRVIEVFESEEAAKRFVTEKLAPAFKALGAAPPPQPQFWPLHSCLSTGRRQ